MPPIDRRTFLISGLAGSASALTGAAAGAAEETPRHPTPAEIEGPFYPVVAQKDRDFDLTRVEGRDGVAVGRIVFIEGRVLDTEGRPIEDATVDLWQANAHGRYRHPHDPNPAPLDPNFQGWAIVASGREGGFRFKTVVPGSYPAGRDWDRPPHIHFKVSKRGYVELTTQMYFEGHPLNEKDRLLNRHPEPDRARMIAKRTSDEPETYRFDIVLAEA